jgi:hypothetical protein
MFPIAGLENFSIFTHGSQNTMTDSVGTSQAYPTRTTVMADTV